ncbi:hypothetical protein J5226_05105 [Lysobacter sp. K5869]|uniref:hypothetical protein n=1 Tax=Lysobacter sp. K5869 TaxID=2820808 RepID=UPI001C060D81|nr:hypothetical protein [Lysobacter sp. K5869]QWP77794.1 hypothetical protein J5226_05105 [Lysobacter sp. K5869]
MIRKLTIPLLAAGLLAGCVSDYTVRGGGGPGTYYYGRPSVDYNYYGGYGGYYGPGYGYYPYGESYRFRYGGYYGNPYYGYGGYPYYYGYPRYYPSRPHQPNPPSNNPPRSDGGMPWRDTRPVGGGAWGPRNPGSGMQQPRSMQQPQMMTPRAPAMPSARRDGGRAWRDVER